MGVRVRIERLGPVVASLLVAAHTAAYGSVGEGDRAKPNGLQATLPYVLTGPLRVGFATRGIGRLWGTSGQMPVSLAAWYDEQLMLNGDSRDHLRFGLGIGKSRPTNQGMAGRVAPAASPDASGARPPAKRGWLEAADLDVSVEDAPSAGGTEPWGRRTLDAAGMLTWAVRDAGSEEKRWLGSVIGRWGDERTPPRLAVAGRCTWSARPWGRGQGRAEVYADWGLRLIGVRLLGATLYVYPHLQFLSQAGEAPLRYASATIGVRSLKFENLVSPGARLMAFARFRSGANQPSLAVPPGWDFGLEMSSEPGWEAVHRRRPR